MTSELKENEKIKILLNLTCKTEITLRLDKTDRSCGFHLTRSKWDPYPWVSYVEQGSVADVEGLKTGDCLLAVDGVDVLGLGVKEISVLIKKELDVTINLQVWRNSEVGEESRENGAAVSGPLPSLAKKLAKALSGAVRALECPVCLETATSPVAQCVHGHILCVGCRTRTPRCPVCRVRLGQGRCLLADEVQLNIREAFEDSSVNSFDSDKCSLREKLFGKRVKKSRVQDVVMTKTKAWPSFARLLLGSFDKAVSADNLASKLPLESPARRVVLSQVDRTKSASTGELSTNQTTLDDPLERSASGRIFVSSSGHLSVPPTPTWGGSTESINNFLCPLTFSNECMEPLNHENFMEHLQRNHSDVIQIHFYQPKAQMPIPPAFGLKSLNIFHRQNEFYFFHYADGEAWMTGTGGQGQWMLHGESSDGRKIKLQRPIAKIENSKPSSTFLAPLPTDHHVTFINIEILPQSETFQI